MSVKPITLRRLWPLLMMAGIALLLFARYTLSGIPGDVREFGERYQKVRNQSDHDAAMNGMLALFHWENTATDIRQAVIRNLYFEMDIPVRSITFRPWVPENDTREFFPEHTCPNLEPKWVMTVLFDESPRHTLNLPVGFDGEAWKIVNPILQES